MWSDDRDECFEKLNNQFYQMLRDGDTSLKLAENTPNDAIRVSSSIGDSYRMRVLEKNKTRNEMIFKDSSESKELDLANFYGSKFLPQLFFGDEIYDLGSLLEKKDVNSLQIPLYKIPYIYPREELSLTIKRTWRDVLFEDINFSQPVYVWDTIKKLFTANKM